MRWNINSDTLKDTFLTAQWPAPKQVKTLITTRKGGVSQAPYDTMNLGAHVQDDPISVEENRKRLAAYLPARPAWLNQIHGVQVLDASSIKNDTPDADGSFTRELNRVCCVMTADCLPVLLCNEQGTQVAAVHAGWRGLLDGIIEVAVQKFDAGDTLLAYLGPAIGPEAFEVGDEVRVAFGTHTAESKSAFKPSGLNHNHQSQASKKWLADLYKLATMRLEKVGVVSVYGGEDCTYQNRDQFFSFRRDGQTGRMASCIWIEQ